MEPFTSTRNRGKSDGDQAITSENPERQPVNKYEGRVRSVNEDSDILVTEAFVRQVCERIQGVIQAKLTPAHTLQEEVGQGSTFLVTTIFFVNSGLNYQALPFYPVPYPTMSPPQVVYTRLTVSQPGNAIPLTNGIDARPNNRPRRTLDPKRKRWICDSNQHLSTACPGKRTNAVVNNISSKYVQHNCSKYQ